MTDEEKRQETAAEPVNPEDPQIMAAEIRRLTGELEQMTNERNALQRSGKVQELAHASGCEIPEFLDYLANKRQIDLQDETAAAQFMQTMKKEYPGCFAATIRPGSGTVPPEAYRKSPAAAGETYGSMLDYVMDKLGTV